MKTRKSVLAAVLAAAALSANAAAPQTEGPISPFTYEALGATPSVTFGRARAGAPAAVEAPKPAATKGAAVRTETPTRAAGATGAPFTYEALGATPHVQIRKPTSTEVLSQPTR